MAEIELKLEITDKDREALAAPDLLGPPAATVAQSSIYFDTKDRLLFSSGFTLRIRRVGDVRIQTVKATGSSASIFARDEWETAVTGNVPVIDHSNPLLNEFGAAARALHPQFEVRVERHIWNIEENGSKIEVALDSGDVIAADRRTPIREIELELKDGSAGDLFILARKIEAIVPFRFGVLSKAERGYRLLDAMRTVVKAEPIELDRRASVIDAFQTVVSSCLRQFRLNETILLANQNPDALHQARVALRRLRSALTLFRPMLEEEPAKRLSGEFRWLAGVLGEARNLDVLLAKTGSDDIRERLLNVRAKAYDDVMEALAAPRVRALMLDFNEWLRCGDYAGLPGTVETRQLTATGFAIGALDKQRKKLKKRGRNLADTDDEQRHEARKDAKKLRYASEFFRSLFDDNRGSRRYRKFIAAMESLQDELGALNDLATGPEVLEQHGLQNHPEAEQLLSHDDKQKLIAKARTALDEVLDSRRFWK